MLDAVLLISLCRLDEEHIKKFLTRNCSLSTALPQMQEEAKVAGKAKKNAQTAVYMCPSTHIVHISLGIHARPSGHILEISQAHQVDRTLRASIGLQQLGDVFHS